MNTIDWINKCSETVRKNKKEFLLLLAVLLIGAFLRLYKIDQYMTFLSDEGRDVLIARRILQGHLTFVGPGTSIGNMYLGPIYYYMMAPALLLANFSPVGPAVMIAFFGIATIFLVWKVAKEWFPVEKGVNFVALTVSFLYAISPTVIIFSRSSWNPNIMPFFALICIYSIWKVYKELDFKWLVVLGISFGFVIQSHYLGLLLIPPIGIYWLLAFRESFYEPKKRNGFIKFSVISFFSFFVLMVPIILFDIKHDFRNTKAMLDFIKGSGGTYSASLENTLSKILPTVNLVFTRLTGARNMFFGLWSTFVILIAGFLVALKKNKPQINLIILWIVFGVLGLAFLRQTIFDHYFGFLFPAPFLLLAAILQYLFEGRLKKFVVILTLVILAIAAAWQSPFKYAADKQLGRSMIISKKILEESNGKEFNLASIAPSNGRDSYQYFLEIWGAKIVDTDPIVPKYTITDQLFVVCEIPMKDCDPTHNPSAWITGFGWSTIENHWEIDGRTIYKLVHSPEWIKLNKIVGNKKV